VTRAADINEENDRKARAKAASADLIEFVVQRPWEAADRIVALEAERDRLAADNAALRLQLSTLAEHVIDDLLDPDDPDTLGFCEFDRPDHDLMCRYCTGEDCGHVDCIGKLGRPPHICEHSVDERHPAGSTDSSTP
jgi:hypothetical protein